MVLLVDVDNTLVDFCGRFAQYYFEETGVVVEAPYSNYDLTKVFPLVSSDKYKYLRDPHFYTDIHVYAGAVEVLNDLKFEGHEILFVTTCVNLESLISKFNLLGRLFSWFDIKKFVVIRNKVALSFDDSILIDDAPRVFEACPDVSYKVCFGQDFNLHLVGSGLIDAYCSNWKQVLDVVRLYNNNKMKASKPR